MSTREGGSDDRTLQCPKCGTGNPRDAAQCLYCGEALRVAEAVPTEQRRLPLLLRLVVSLVVGCLVLAISCDVAFDQFRDSHVVGLPGIRTLAYIAALRDAVETYRSERHSLPSSLRNLPMPKGAYVQTDESGAPVDGWRRPFRYSTDGAKYQIVSYGRDGKLGGLGIDCDLSTRDLAEHEALVQKNTLPLVRRARPTFEQFIRDRGEFGMAGSGYMMFVMSIVTAAVALVLSLVSLSGRVPAHRGVWTLIRRFLITIAATLFIALVYIIPFHAPTGH
jgi:hypothetical protein